MNTLYDDYLKNKGIDPNNIKIDKIFIVPKNKGKKNKGVKHTVRGNIFRLNKKYFKIQTLSEYNTYTKNLLLKLIIRETPSNIYILCPYHVEKTASMTISKTKIGLCKCFGCGKSINFHKMILETLGKPSKKIKRITNYNINYDDDLPF